MEIKDKVFVVTGGASGIGRELVLGLVKKGASVAACDINMAGLEETVSLAGEFADKISIHKLNIANLEEVIDFPKIILEKHGKVDGLINNAGIIQPFTPFVDLELSTINRVMNVNFYGMLYLTKVFLPILLENKTKSCVMNVASMGGLFPFPKQTVYGASKGAVKLLSEGLYAELKDTNVFVGTVYPGGVDTNIASSTGANFNKESAKEKSSYKMLAASKCADIIIKSIEKEKVKTLAGSDARILDKLYRLNPIKTIKLLVDKMKNL